MPPIYAIISFFSYRFFRDYTYYSLIEVVYEAFTISAFLLLIIEYVADTAVGHNAVHAIARKDKQKLPIPAYFMYTIKWSVMQYVIIRPGKPPASAAAAALTPESAASVAVIGHARDLGMCSAVQRDGKKCGGWCDKRVADVCDYHIQRAVERRRSSRAEFSVGTSGLSSTAPKRKPAYDPARQWGLKPEAETSMGDAGGATYVVSGHVVSGNAGSLYVGENLGREAQARAQRKGKGDDDRALKMLLQRDKEGMMAVEKARQYAEKMKAKEREEAAGMGKGKGKAKQKDKGRDNGKEKGKEKNARTEGEKRKSGSEECEEESQKDEATMHKNAYSAQVIKKLGFDPTMKPGQRRQEDPEIQNKASATTGKRQSVVSAPKNQPTRPSNTSAADLPDLSDDEELENREKEAFGKALNVSARPSAGMVNLDSSDDELIIEPEETE
ncbi:hypothetical protein EWM64_g9115 [Hericium alpestre]|uniref:Zinc finger Mcm10/DnaG-type domain-containing protein n=1 Tax=Hericium alpestre TaxID=135208 RepID=A0A4Y9ZLC8_9AGAM|nr:hypothetical protein EWM64_g9115 [Hericium alpestre]